MVAMIVGALSALLAPGLAFAQCRPVGERTREVGAGSWRSSRWVGQDAEKALPLTLSAIGSIRRYEGMWETNPERN